MPAVLSGWVGWSRNCTAARTALRPERCPRGRTVAGPTYPPRKDRRHVLRRDQRPHRPRADARDPRAALRQPRRGGRQDGRLRALRAAAARRGPGRLLRLHALGGKGALRGVAVVAGIRPGARPALRPGPGGDRLERVDLRGRRVAHHGLSVAASMDALEALLTRRSIGRLTEPAPSEQELRTMLAAATAAPDHGRSRPCRFIVLRGPGPRALADAFAQAQTVREPEAAGATSGSRTVCA